ncbi:hypothetical protein ACFW04_014316 [Cataglyphis niger]
MCCCRDVTIRIPGRERQQKYARAEVAEEKKFMFRWQWMWDRSEKGCWTHWLISQIKKWMARRDGEVDFFYLTQFLTDHGCFRACFFKFKHEENPYCPSCQETLEDEEQLAF